MELDVSGSENEIGLSTDSESDNDINFSGSETSEEVEDSDINEDSASENENDSSPQKTYTAQENACMAILSLISRHCITCLLYTSPSPRDLSTSRMPSSA